MWWTGLLANNNCPFTRKQLILRYSGVIIVFKSILHTHRLCGTENMLSQDTVLKVGLSEFTFGWFSRQFFHTYKLWGFGGILIHFCDALLYLIGLYNLKGNKTMTRGLYAPFPYTLNEMVLVVLPRYTLKLKLMHAPSCIKEAKWKLVVLVFQTTNHAQHTEDGGELNT